MGFQDVMKQQEIRRNKEKGDKNIEKEETKNATKTATILWRFLLAIFDYKTGDFFEVLAIFAPTNRGYNHIYIYIYL